MTGYTVHTGSSVKFSSGWDRVFQDGGKTKKSKGNQPTPSVKATKKAAVKAVKKATATTQAKSTKKTVATKSVKRGK